MKTTEKAKKTFAGRAAGIIYLSVLVLCLTCAVIFSLHGRATKIYSYSVTYRGETTEYNSEISDTESVLESMGIELDNVVYTESKNNLIVSVDVKDLFLVSVTSEGRTSFLSLEEGATVSHALSELAVTVDEDDRVSVGMTDAVYDGMEITVSQVETVFTETEVAIAHETEKVENSSMKKGTTNVKTEGVDGVKKLTYKSVFVDGVRESYDFYEETVVTEPVTEVIEYGTKEETPAPTKKPSSSSSSSSSNKKPSSSSSSSSNKKPSSSGPSYYKGSSDKYKDNGDGTVTTFDGKVLKYSKVLNIKASAYTYMNNKMDITASGVPVQVGVVAAHKNTIPMGTKVYIVGKYGTWEYGVATVGDTGCAAGKVDLFMTSYDECMDFGVRGATVYILE